MPDPTPGSVASVLTGNPGNPGNPAPPPAAGGEGGAPPPAPGAGAPPAASWLDSIQDPETKTWAESKGWKGPEDVLKSSRNLEKLLGSEKIPLPKDAADAEGWDRFHKAAGRPDTPDGYGLDKLEGADPEFSKAAASVFHESGISVAQAQKVVEWYGKQSASMLAAQESAFTQQVELDVRSLQEEWGAAFPAKIEAAKRATKLAGLDDATTQKLERALGPKAATELFAKIGEATTEAKFHTAGGSPDPFMTPAGATQKIAQLKADPAWSKAYMGGDTAARSELARLQKLELGMQP